MQNRDWKKQCQYYPLPSRDGSSWNELGMWRDNVKPATRIEKLEQYIELSMNREVKAATAMDEISITIAIV